MPKGSPIDRRRLYYGKAPFKAPRRLFTAPPPPLPEAAAIHPRREFPSGHVGAAPPPPSRRLFTEPPPPRRLFTEPPLPLLEAAAIYPRRVFSVGPVRAAPPPPPQPPQPPSPRSFLLMRKVSSATAAASSFFPAPAASAPNLPIFHREEDVCYSEEDVYYDEKDLITTKGPGYPGFEPYDNNCIFPNLVHMTYKQVKHLLRIVEKLPRPAVKEYVVTMTQNFINPQGSKMVFTYERVHFKISVTVFDD